MAEKMREPMRVCVYCASSSQANPAYAEAAGRLGRHLARSGVTVVYGGGGIGSMKALADEALAAGGAGSSACCRASCTRSNGATRA